MARMNTRKYKNITIKLKNFFKEDLSHADIVITYLYPGLLDALLEKLERELRAGTLLYSFDFAFSKKEPEHVEHGKGRAAARGERLLAFQF